MSLIPSESYSFPDHFTKTVVPSRKPKNVDTEQAPVETRRTKPSIVALPDPEPAPAMAKQSPQPMRKVASPAPNPALRRASAPSPRIPSVPARKIAISPTLKPKASSPRVPPMDPTPATNNGNGAAPVVPESLMPPAQNIIQMIPTPLPVRPRSAAPPQKLPTQSRPRVAPAKLVAAASAARVSPVQIVQRPAPPPPKPRPAPVVATSQADFFESFAQNGDGNLAKRRRKMKFRRFVTCESVALAVLLALAIVGLSHRPSNAVVLWIMNISTIASAIAAALIPIFFYAFTPTLPEIEE